MAPFLQYLCAVMLFFPPRLPDHDGRLVLRVRVRGGGGQEARARGDPGRDAAGAHCPASLGPHGGFGQVKHLAPRGHQK